MNNIMDANDFAVSGQKEIIRQIFEHPESILDHGNREPGEMKRPANQNDPTFTPASIVGDEPTRMIKCHSSEFLVAVAEPTHDTIATALAGELVAEFRFVAAESKWYFFDGKVWSEDELGKVIEKTREFCRRLAAYKDGSRVRLLSEGGIKSVVRLAQSDQRLAVRRDIWDRDLHLLNTPAGVVNLKTGESTPHRSDFYMSKITGVAPGDACPTFHQFLDRFTGGDEDLKAYLQKLFGYAATGETNEQMFAFLFGHGANGKSVLLETISGLIGDYHVAAPIEAFMEAKHERHSSDIARLQGARFVTSNETNPGRAINESLIKQITGGDKIVARKMRQDGFEFKPQLTLVIAGNNKPALKTTGEAMRRRVHLIPCEVTIPEHERDANLSEKLKEEWPGILQWIIDGAVAWYRSGLSAPAAVRAATNDYLSEEDLIEKWMEECCERHSMHSVPRIDAYLSWADFAKSNGEEPGNSRSFYQKVEAHGIRSGKSGSARTFKGIRLKPTENPYELESRGA